MRYLEVWEHLSASQLLLSGGKTACQPRETGDTSNVGAVQAVLLSGPLMEAVLSHSPISQHDGGGVCNDNGSQGKLFVATDPPPSSLHAAWNIIKLQIGVSLFSQHRELPVSLPPRGVADELIKFWL